MTFFRHLLFIVFIFFLSFKSKAQSVEIVSHYPTSAYMVNRLLPFSVFGTEAINIVSVQLVSGDSCQTFPDRFLANVFHFYCTAPTQVSAELTYLIGEQSFVSQTANINIVEMADPANTNNNPGEEPQPSAPGLFNKAEGE